MPTKELQKGVDFVGVTIVYFCHDGAGRFVMSKRSAIKIDPSKVANGEPHKFDEVGWFTLDTIPENSHSLMPDFLKLYRDKLQDG